MKNASLKTAADWLAYRNSKIDNLFNGSAFRGGLIDETDKKVSLEARLDGDRTYRARLRYNF